VGNGKSGQKLMEKVKTENKLFINIKGLIIDDAVFQTELDNAIKEEKIDEILISIDDKSYEDLMHIIDLCGKYKIDIKLSSELFGIVPKKIQTKKYYDIPIIDISTRQNSAFYLKFKRIVDVLLSLTGFIFLTPVFLIIMISIKFSSKGPIFYKQKRVGLNGNLFDFYKFRSMYVEKGEDKKRENMMLDFMKNNKTQKIIDAARVTRVGNFIRKTSLDELPQLFNVIKGNMSIVGPRPCLPYEFANYADWQKRRLKVLPGCTGVWQVSGRSSVSFIDSIVLDLFYINNMSPLYDILLIFKTIPVMFFSKGGV
jgi:undecaprenyl-phosphate galactose phosphotransferase